ncbi:acetyltransferase [Jannaschia pagri]|uniref:Acetyltransferase n=1 Tax=Jannaschia pagri TaxID=2829797 RepID=A0ABQ4NLB5_9RHOB|nr:MULTISPECIES: GNAT family N-acetyltransferase [unclassified Jannaschia]GIT91193.1 acetyltransferase [Jannaschia sp. AI_61]GIT95025.1 acetyltransferase [Jannaschia sp. AI_62]
MIASGLHTLDAIAPLETERLVLRVPIEADWPEHLAFGLSDRMQFTGGPTNRWGAWRSFTSMLGHWVLRGYGFWQILEKSTGDRIGKAGLLFHDGWPEPELAWHLYDGNTGKGFATEAARAARTDAWSRLGLGPLISPIDADNHASRAVARRLGARVEGTGALLGSDVEIWRHPDPVRT